MYKSEVISEESNKNNILHRSSLRGLKKCTSCGFINGQRALICRNTTCDLRIKRLESIKPFDPIQLITSNETKIFSLRTKEKLLNPRNFVSITETRNAANAEIISRKAVCYVDTCKYDSYDSTHICCKHIKACAMLTKLSLAEAYPIDKGILWNLNIPNEQKQSLWNLYRMDEKQTHPIQKLNPTTFVVRCSSSKMFPAGRLHVTVFGNTMANKSGCFSCSCKKLKIVLEPDNSVTLKKEICDHLLLLLAAILNKPEGKSLYGSFLDSLQYLWMPTSLNPPLIDCSTRPTQFIDFDFNLDKCNKANIKLEDEIIDHHHPDDIFNFSEELFAENNIPDFSDIILDVKNEEISNNIPAFKNEINSSCLDLYIKDPKFNVTTTSMNDEDLDLNLNFPQIKTTETMKALPPPPTTPPIPLTTTTVTTPNAIDFNENSLSVIEHFQLNHNMQVSNDNMALAKDIENLNNLESQVLESTTPTISIKTNSLLKSTSTNSSDECEPKPCKIIKSTTTCQSVVPVNKPLIFKQSPVKIIKIATPTTGIIHKLPTVVHNKNNKIIQISKIFPNKIIVLKPSQIEKSSKLTIVDNIKTTPSSSVPEPPVTNQIPDANIMPSLSYESWLDHLIEIINDSITIQEDTPPNVKHTLHVPESIFSYFSKTFGLNQKSRLPNVTSLIKSGKYKDHIKYVWYFNQASTVQRIFCTKNTKIVLERSFESLSEIKIEPFEPTNITKNPPNYCAIHPKLHSHKISIQFTNTTDNSTNISQPYKNGLKLEWLPSAFPKSNFGLMTIEFCVSVKETIS